MSNNTIIPLHQPDTIDDPLTDVLRSGARELLAKAVEAEVEEFLAAHASLRTADGLKRIVRHLSADVSNTHIDVTALSAKCKPASARLQSAGLRFVTEAAIRRLANASASAQRSCRNGPGVAFH
jgi:hypothetical protein